MKYLQNEEYVVFSSDFKYFTDYVGVQTIMM